LFWFHGIAQCHQKDPLPKGVKQQKHAEATWPCRTPCQKGWVHSSPLGAFFNMTLGNANVWYHMQSISLHTFNMCFYCLCACVFFHICCLWHCPSVSQIKPLAKRGSQHRCTGQLALQKHAAGWCHWGDGSVDLFPRFQGILVFKKFEELVYVGV
jgi:hypothetical protein